MAIAQDTISALFLPIAFVAVMFLLLILPQKRREKEAQRMISSLQVGDEVVTIGGIIAKILNINANEVTIETGVEKSQIKIAKWAIKQVAKQVN